jgi:N4-gp56 family major capsid protein
MSQFDNILATVNNAATKNGSALFANIVQEAIFTAQERSIMLPLVSVYDISGTAGKTIQVPVYPTVAASALVETADITSEADVAPTAVNITAEEYGVMSIVTDLMKSSASQNVAADIGRMLGEAIAKKQDETISALFSGFSNDGTPSSGVNSELTAEILFRAAALLRESNAPGPYYVVVTPRAAFNLKKQLANLGGVALGQLSDLGNAALREGFVGTIAGMQVFESTSIAVDSANGIVGAAFAPQAIGVALKKGLTIEVQRDASRRADEIVATATWGVGELVDAYGVKLTLDSQF